MDYQNRAGSKKGAAGIASDAQSNLARRKQVEELLKDGEEIPYTFQDDNAQDEKLRKNPYIYKNHSGKLVCKLCNTMHVSWSSVERHLSGKKHGLNVLRRGNTAGRPSHNSTELIQGSHDREFQMEVEARGKSLQKNGIVPKCTIVNVKDRSTGDDGVAIEVDFDINEDDDVSKSKRDLKVDENIPPMIRIVSGLELQDAEKKDKKYLVIAFEPFENVAIQIPSDKEIKMNENNVSRETVDEVNEKCAYWDEDNRKLYVQLFFQ